MPTATKTAVLYLRVSSPGQVHTDYNPEGLSIPAQREACEEKAKQLGAKIIREYVEPGVSGGSLLKRKAFRAMIASIAERTDADYVIVWSVSRWARDLEDYYTARGTIRRAGAQLISAKEPIGGETASAITLEGVLAAVAAGRRIEISEEVRRGIHRKAQVGGTPFRAPLGYLNERELIEGREIRTIVVDPDRGPLVTEAFLLYASGDYALSDLAAILEGRGLRTRPRRHGEPPQPVPVNQLAKMLRNRYYIGTVCYGGKSYEGELYPRVVDRDEEGGGVPSRLIKTDRREGGKEGTPWRMFAGSPSGRTTRSSRSRWMISPGRALAG
jgi:site-specific DNA recombinase